MYWVHDQYILEKKSMYQVLVTYMGKKYVLSTYRFMSVYSGTIPL